MQYSFLPDNGRTLATFRSYSWLVVFIQFRDYSWADTPLHGKKAGHLKYCSDGLHWCCHGAQVTVGCSYVQGDTLTEGVSPRFFDLDLDECWWCSVIHPDVLKARVWLCIISPVLLGATTSPDLGFFCYTCFGSCCRTLAGVLFFAPFSTYSNLGIEEIFGFPIPQLICSNLTAAK